jgi:hypothetical protein
LPKETGKRFTMKLRYIHLCFSAINKSDLWLSTGKSTDAAFSQSMISAAFKGYNIRKYSERVSRIVRAQFHWR